MEIQDWTIADPEDQEITGQHGAQLGVTVNKDQNDIVVEIVGVGGGPSTNSNEWYGDPTKLFNIQAVNLPVMKSLRKS